MAVGDNKVSKSTLGKILRTELAEKNGWRRFVPQSCDLCSKVAVWKHRLGGYRCNSCPTPAVTEKTT